MRALRLTDPAAAAQPAAATESAIVRSLAGAGAPAPPYRAAGRFDRPREANFGRRRTGAEFAVLRGLDFGSAPRVGRQGRDPREIFALDPLAAIGAFADSAGAFDVDRRAASPRSAETRREGALAMRGISCLRLGNQAFAEMRRTAAPARARRQER